MCSKYHTMDHIIITAQLIFLRKGMLNHENNSESLGMHS